MSYFDDASLVMIPSGYKDQKVYSVKPIDGTGDLTFTRSNDTATRVNSSGLIEKVRTNLFAYSNEFDNAYWTKPQSSLVSGQPDPNGGTTAFKLVEDTSTNFHWLLKSGPLSGAGEWGLSIFAKPAGRNYISIGNASIGEYSYFNLLNGTVVSSHPNAIGKIEAAGNGFYRCSVTLLTSSDSATGFFISTDGSTRSYTGDGTSGLIIFGAQLETGVTTDYIATTSAAVSVGPVANLPRLDYSGGATCPSLLLEPQRTNAALWSESFDNGHWAKYAGAIVTANTAISPDGYQNADTLTTTAGQEIYASMGGKAASPIAYTFSVFAKYNNAAQFRIVSSDFATGSCTGIFNLQTGTASFYEGPNWSNTSVKMENYGNGWYRCIMTSTTPATTGLYISLLTPTSGSAYIYGMQTEQAAYATSYIPTLSAAVTRGADSVVKTSVSSLIGQTEGTIYAEVDFDSSVDTEGYIIRIDESSFDDTIFVARGGDKILSGVLRSGGSTIVQLQQGAFNGVNKLAFAYKSGSFALYVNGTQVATSAATYTNGITYDEIRIGGFGASTANMCGGIKQTLLFKTRLSNADLATLTTL